MSYIGSTPTTQSFIAGTDSFNGTGSQTDFTLTRLVNSVNDVQVVVNNVVQYPPNYSVSGNTLTISPAPSAGTDNVYVRYLSTTLQSITVPGGSTVNGTFQVAQSTYLATSSGNVGVGTTSPAAKLDVNGQVNATSIVCSLAGGIIRAQDGSAALPSLQPGIDNDTGFFRPASNTIGFSTAGTERARIDSSGNFKFNSGYGSVATAYGCRAWVNFNGTGTVAIRASGNVSSITDNGTGQYTVNFTTAMADANYSVVAVGAPTTTPTTCQRWPATVGTLATSSVKILTPVDGSTAATLGDFALVNVSIFR